MPLEALSANARLIVPVGAIDSRCEFRRPLFRTTFLMSSGRRVAKLVPERYRSALKSGNAPRSFASSAEARYARSRMAWAMRAAMWRASSVSYFNLSRMSASPRPVKPRPTRRFAIASWRCCSSGQAVTSSTLSSMRIATSTVRPNLSKSKDALSANALLTYFVRSIEPRQQQP